MRPTKQLLAAAGLAAALAIAAGIAYAAVPNGGTITACYGKGGALHVIDSTVTDCKKNETKLEWNQSGPPGQDGKDGKDGAPGVSGYEIVTNERADDARGFFGSVSVACPMGKKVLGGGAIAELASGGVQSGFDVVNSSPVGDGGWQATFNIDNPFSDDVVMTVYAICANVT